MANGMRQEEVNELAFIDEGFIRMYGLHPNNVLDYFALSPFYDKKSNNEMVRMQRLGLEVLNTMKGIEYRLLHSGHEPVLFIVVKQERASEKSVRQLAIYYILDKTIYAAPTLHRLIVSRLMKGSTHLLQALEILNGAMRFAPAKGFTWHFDGEDANLKLWRQSSEAVAYEMRRRKRDEKLERRGEQEIGAILSGLVSEYRDMIGTDVAQGSVQAYLDMNLDESTEFESLHKLVAFAGLSMIGVTEKKDVLERAREAQKILKERQQILKEGDKFGMKVMRIGAFECLVFGLDSEKRIDAIVTILHGFGSTYHDFIPLQKQLAQSAALAGQNIVYVFPQAHALEMTMGSTAWWEIEVARWMHFTQLGEAGISKLIRDKPPGLNEARRNVSGMVGEIRKLVEATRKQNKGRAIPFVLGGFSQGGMTALDVSLMLPDASRVDHVIVLSSGPIVVGEWSEKLRTRGKSMHVLMAHSEKDTVIPMQAASRLKDLLESFSVNLRFETHDHAHAIGPDHIVVAIADFIRQAINSKNDIL